MIKLIREFEALARRAELGVVVEVAVGMTANVAESLQVLVRLFAVTEGE